MANEPVGPSDAEDILGMIPGGGTAITKGPKVWTGTYITKPETAPLGVLGIQPKTGSPYAPVKEQQFKLYQSIDNAVMEYYSFSPQYKKALSDMAVKLGYIKAADVTDTALVAVWEKYVRAAAGYQVKGREMTPWSVMLIDSLSQEQAKEAGVPSKEPVTTTTTSTDLSTRLDARGILYTASRSLLGRDPTEQESTRFWQALNEAERNNPVTTTTTTSFGPSGEAASQTATSSGGLSADAKQLLSVEEAKKNPEYGAYQAATTFMDALRGMVYGKGY